MLKKLVNYLRKNHPETYFSLVSLSDKLKHQKKTIHIFDNCGGSFKKYIAEEDMTARLENLKSNLDEYSKKTVDTLFERLLNYPESHYGVEVKQDLSTTIGGLLDEESNETRAKVKKQMKQVNKQFRFARNNMDPSVFYFDHGLVYLPEGIKDYLNNQDFIDLGAYFGDSALSLSKYNYKKIYSVEFSPKAIENYKVWMNKNNINPLKYQIVQAAMSSSDDNPPIYLSGNDYTLYSDLRSDKDNSTIEVKQRSLDSIVNEHAIAPKLIKADIEGYALECMKGAKETLTKHRPVLSLAIYHNPYEFFETKPYLESILSDYTYMIRKMATVPFGLRSHAETILMAYPNEIVK